MRTHSFIWQRQRVVWIASSNFCEKGRTVCRGTKQDAPLWIWWNLRSTKCRPAGKAQPLLGSCNLQVRAYNNYYTSSYYKVGPYHNIQGIKPRRKICQCNANNVGLVRNWGFCMLSLATNSSGPSLRTVVLQVCCLLSRYMAGRGWTCTK